MILNSSPDIRVKYAEFLTSKRINLEDTYEKPLKSLFATRVEVCRYKFLKPEIVMTREQNTR